MAVYRSLSRVVRLPTNLTFSLSRTAIGAEPPFASPCAAPSPLTATPLDLPFLRPSPRRQLSTSANPSPNYEHHVPLNSFEQTFLAIGSALASLNNPYRGDMVAVLSETTAGPFLSRLRDQMLEEPSGRNILRNRPRIRSGDIDLAYLKKLDRGTFGRSYVDWLDKCSVSPDTREPVRYIDSPELAYVMQRYRECHDFYHVIAGGFPVSVSGEVVVKWFELANMGLPVAALSAVFGPLRLSSGRRSRLLRAYVPWALKCGSSARPLISVEWEAHWERPIEQLRRELGIWDPPLNFDSWKAEEARLKREAHLNP